MIHDSCGVLMMCENSELTGMLGRMLHEAGWTVSHADDVPRPLSFAALPKARIEYVRLRDVCTHTAVVGEGRLLPLALLLAEAYPLDAAVCLSADDRVLSPLAGRLARLARRNLFAITAPLFVCAQSADARLILRGISSGIRESLSDECAPEVKGASVLSFLSRRMMDK